MIYYDDTCKVCSRFISFLKKRNAQLTYTGLSKAVLPKKFQNIDSIILQKEDFYYVYSDAAIRAICAIGGIYKVFLVLLVVPRFIRDWVYQKTAKNRHCLTTN